MADKFYIKQNDRLPELTGQFLTPEGDPVNLTGATLRLHMQRSEDTLDVAIQVDGEPTNGRFRYAWAAGDTDEAGRFPAEIQATYPGNRPLTSPNRKNITIVITPELL
jgi:hypothetical protein